MDEKLAELEAIAAVSLAAGAAPAVLLPMDVEKEGEGLELWAASMLEYLLPEHQAIVKKVQAKGLGICSSCRWSSGCHRCSWVKAVRYWRHFETRGAEEGYSSSKPKSKLLAGGGDWRIEVGDGPQGRCEY